MNEEQVKYITKTLNKIGVLVYHEVNGIQHRFRLSIKELSPSSVVFQNNRENIEDTQYTLVPVQIAQSIYCIGKKLFDPSCYYTDNPIKQLSKHDYINTKFGKYVAEGSLSKMEQYSDLLLSKMRQRADEKIKDKYEKYYRDAFMFAYRFFSAEMKEFREQLKMLNGSQDLFWKEIKKIFLDLKDIEDKFCKQHPNSKMMISDLDRPDLKTAYKLQWIPQDYDKYRKELGFSFIYTGFHQYSFLKYKWSELYWNIEDMDSARSLFFERDSKSTNQPNLIKG